MSIRTVISLGIKGGIGMSKQDRQGVRTPQDVERKYNLGGAWNEIEKLSQKYNDGGEPGATYTPNVSEDGILSWTNNKGLANPAPINLVALVLDALPEQTKQRTIAIDGKVYQAEEAMTWEEWIASEYSNGAYTLGASGIVQATSGKLVYFNETTKVWDDHFILSGHEYLLLDS